MSSMLSLFSFQALEKLDLEVLDFWLFTELSILEWFLNWFFKHARIPVRMYYHSLIKFMAVFFSTVWLKWIVTLSVDMHILHHYKSKLAHL